MPWDRKRIYWRKSCKIKVNANLNVMSVVSVFFERPV
jgi:hypothetical protein